MANQTKKPTQPLDLEKLIADLQSQAAKADAARHRVGTNNDHLVARAVSEAMAALIAALGQQGGAP